MDFVACKYDSFWWVGLICEVDEVSKDVKVVFLHPHGPVKSFAWPNREDCCWIPLTNILQVIKTPTTVQGQVVYMILAMLIMIILLKMFH